MTAEELAQMTRLRRPLEAEHWRGVLNVLAILKHDPAWGRAIRPRRAAHGHRCHRRYSKKEGLVEFAGLDLLRLGTSFMPRRGPRPGSWRLGAADDDGAAPHHLLCAARHPRRDRARHERQDRGRWRWRSTTGRFRVLDPARGRSRARARAPGGTEQRTKDRCAVRRLAAEIASAKAFLHWYDARRMREAERLSVPEIARRLRLDEQYVFKLLKGTAPPEGAASHTLARPRLCGACGRAHRSRAETRRCDARQIDLFEDETPLP